MAQRAIYGAEMIEEFSTGLFESRLEQHSFKSPLGPVEVSSELKEYLDIVQELLHSQMKWNQILRCNI